MKDPKKLAAAIAAVTTYIKTEEEALMMAQAPAPEKRPRPTFYAWSLSGRQAMMQNRNLMEMKGFHAFKLLKNSIFHLSNFLRNLAFSHQA